MPDFRRLSRDRPFAGNGFRDNSGDDLVQTEHVEEYPADLGEEEWPDGYASGDICLQDIGQYLDIVHVVKYLHVSAGLCHQRIPLSDLGSEIEKNE